MANPSLIKQKLFPRAFLLLTLILTCALQSRADDEVTIDNIKYSIWDSTATVQGLDNESLTTDLIIPDSIVYNKVSYPVESIGPTAFFMCDNLKSVTIGNSVKTIDILAFGNCGQLTSVSIPSSVNSITERAFESCSSLQILLLTQIM
jgi:hypothetical protein